MIDGLDNLGIVHYKDHADPRKIKMHLRSNYSGVKTCFCDKLAELYGGGGHKGAASFKVFNDKFKTMLCK